MKPNYAALIKELPAEAAKALQQLRIINSKALGGVSVADNLFAEFVELPFVHGEPIQRPSPLRGRSIPKGFEVIAAWDADNNAIDFPTQKFDENFDGSGEYQLTFRAQPPEGSISLIRSTAQPIANNTNSYVSWSSSVYQGGALSFATDTVTCAKAGVVSVQWASVFDTKAGGRRQWSLEQNGGTAFYADEIETIVNDYGAGSGAADVLVAAGDTLKLFVFQTCTATTATDLLANRTRMQARYVAPPIGYSGTVLGIMWGG